MKYVIDLKNIGDSEELHLRLSESMGFPGYYGRNLDALYDVLTEGSERADLSFINLAMAKSGVSEYMEKIRRVLWDVRKERPGLRFRVFEREEIPLRTVIFDIGNVLIRFSNLDFIREKYGDEMGLKIANALYGGERWAELDRGAMSVEEVLQTFYDSDPSIPREYINWSLENISGAILRCGYAIPWIREVKKLGYRVMYLSNYSRYVMDARPEALDFLPLMEGGIFSCDVKLIKPDREIYRLFLKRFGLRAQECLFIDDRQDNCEGAAAEGMDYYRFGSYEKDKPEIMSILNGQED